MGTERDKSMPARLHELRMEHRELDELVTHLSEQGTVDQLLIRRLKKRKLQLKDQIELIRSQLIPNLDA